MPEDQNNNDTTKKGLLSNVIKGGMLAGATIVIAKELFKEQTNIISQTDDTKEVSKEYNTTYINSNIKRPPVNKYGNSWSNILNGGFIAEQGGILYYCIDEALYSSTLDNKSVQLMDKTDAYNINPVGEWVYFCNSVGIYKININGKIKIKLSDIYAKYMQVINNKIFVTDKSDILYCLDETGQEIKLPQITKACSLNIVDEKLYYVEIRRQRAPYGGNGYVLNTTLYEKDLNGNTKSVKDLETDVEDSIAIDGGSLYHISNGDLYRIQFNPYYAGFKPIQEYVEKNYLIYDGWIYFSKYHIRPDVPDTMVKSAMRFILNDYRINEGLFKMKVDGTCLTKISADNWLCKNKVCIIDDYIYSLKGSSSNSLKRIHINSTPIL